jgi:endo-1,4-beta-xylanase
VIYFLHGAGGNENSDVGGFSGLVAKNIKDGTIPPFICVFSNGGMSGYVDRADTKVMGDTMIIKELIPLIDADYRTIASRDGRAIAGFSMGSGGAVRLIIKHPDLFSRAASWAAGLRSRRRDAGADDSVILAVQNANDPVKLAEQNNDKLKGKVRILMIVGDKDLTYEGHKPLAAKLKELDIEHEYKVLEGLGHNLNVYYQKTGDELVQFLAKDIKKKEK